LVGVGVDTGVADGLEAGLRDLAGEAGQELPDGDHLPLAAPSDLAAVVALLLEKSMCSYLPCDETTVRHG
jgi:hypothetical protein